MVIFRSIIVLAVLAAFLSMGVACSSKDPSNQTAGNTEEESQPVAEAEQENQPVAQTDDQQQTAEGQESQPAAQPQEVAKEESPDAAPKTLALTGTVEKAGENIVLSTDLGDYIVAGQDLSALVGKTVNVTGAVEESNGEYTINVESFSEE